MNIKERTHIERLTSTLQDRAIILNGGLPEGARMDLRGPDACALP